jgi:hypothetical protein
MSIQDWAALSAAVTTIAGTVALSIRWMVKHYLYELRPNGGCIGQGPGLIDLEERVDQIFVLLSERK